MVTVSAMYKIKWSVCRVVCSAATQFVAVLSFRNQFPYFGNRNLTETVLENPCLAYQTVIRLQTACWSKSFQGFILDQWKWVQARKSCKGKNARKFWQTKLQIQNGIKNANFGPEKTKNRDKPVNCLVCFTEFLKTLEELDWYSLPKKTVLYNEYLECGKYILSNVFKYSCQKRWQH